MITRRDLLAAGAALGASPAMAQGLPGQEALLRFAPLGQVTLLHMADLHAQLVPMHFREPSTNLGVGEARGLVPHLTGEALLAHYRVPRGSPMAHALADTDFDELARRFGPMGGLDRLATLIAAIRAERPGRTLLLDGGDTWQGSWTSLQSRGAEMVAALNLLGADATTGHWEFTFGAERVRENIQALDAAFLAGNVQEAEWDEDVFAHTKTFERGGVQVAVIGQAFPYTPIANPAWMVPEWRFGLKEEKVAARVRAAREGGAQLVVLLSHNGFDVDRKLASRVPGIDVILTGHTHDALPEPLVVGRTLLLASGCHGKFLGRLDLEVSGGRVVGWRHALIPVFANAIRPDPAAADFVARMRAPHAAELGRVVARAETALWRRGNVAGTMDEVICTALATQRDAEIALSPAFRWGYAITAGSQVTAEDVYAHTAITYPAAYRTEMTGAQLRALLEDVAENLFHPDPYAQQGGDMVRSAGLAYSLHVNAATGQRIQDLRLTRTGAPLEAARRYTVAGWGSVNRDTEGPPVWEVIFRHLATNPVLRPVPREDVRLVEG